MSKTIFWPEDRTFSVKDLIHHLRSHGLDPDTTEIEIDVDQDTGDAEIRVIKLRCYERVDPSTKGP